MLYTQSCNLCIKTAMTTHEEIPKMSRQPCQTPFLRASQYWPLYVYIAVWPATLSATFWNQRGSRGSFCCCAIFLTALCFTSKRFFSEFACMQPSTVSAHPTMTQRHCHDSAKSGYAAAVGRQAFSQHVLKEGIGGHLNRQHSKQSTGLEPLILSWHPQSNLHVH